VSSDLPDLAGTTVPMRLLNIGYAVRAAAGDVENLAAALVHNRVTVSADLNKIQHLAGDVAAAHL
jgi:hypothetical protein